MRDAVRGRHLAHLGGNLRRFRAVVGGGKRMAMNINHERILEGAVLMPKCETAPARALSTI